MSSALGATCPHEIADCRRADQAEARLRSFMDHSPALAWMKDEAVRYVYANERLGRIPGVVPDDILGRTDSDRFPEEVAGQLRDHDLAVLTTGWPVQVVEAVPMADGRTHFLLALKFPFSDSAGRRLVGGMALDITGQEGIVAQLAEQLRISQELNAELARANARLAELARTDELTGLANRRHFREALGTAFTRATACGEPLSVAMLDVDDFKAYNDAFGHRGGDEVLREIAETLRETLRESDLVARHGGEEFAVLLPQTDAHGGRIAGKRMRAAVERHAWSRRPVTISVGVATLGEPISDPDSLVDEADRALYRAKRSGRNRVMHVEEVGLE